jgi:endonuclease-3 related protein
MHDTLLAVYGPQGWWPAESSFEVILGAYLTQNTSWKAVTRSLANMRTARVFSFSALREVSLYKLQELIRPSGFITRKAQALKTFVAMLDAEFQGSLDVLADLPAPELRARLLALPGVGPETADAILLYALGHPVPVADEYLRRIAERHELVEAKAGGNRKGYDGLVQLTRAAFSMDADASRLQLYREFHALVVAVGKAHCRKMPRCEACPLSPDLPRGTLSDRMPQARRNSLLPPSRQIKK